MCFTSTPVHLYLHKMLVGQCSFSCVAQYSWTDVSWVSRWDHGSSPMSSQALLNEQTRVQPLTYNVEMCTMHGRMMHMFTLCFRMLPLWVESTDGTYGCITSVTHFDSSTRTLRFWCPITHPATPPSLALWIIFSVWPLLQLQNQG